MAVRIRLRRMGAKKAPFYRIVVADSRSPRDGRFIEEIGYYDPLKDPVVIKIDEEKAIDWMKKGARLSDTARALFYKAGVLKKAPAEVNVE
ncbi:MAG: 30S ribosomal protein S16 [Desulfotomaculaceae bacterium]|nr:30S ribosomal protein S16 [Desulfotomaculaceae bacterium]